MRGFAAIVCSGSLGLATAFAGEPILPGYLTDPTAGWQDLAASATQVSEKFRYPYVAVNDLEATVLEGKPCRIGWYVTDFDHSLIRFGDTSRRFDVTVKVTTDRENFRTFKTEKVPSGDGETDLGPLPVGGYFIGLTAVDRKTKLPSHTVWREFRVVPKDFFVIPPERVLTVTDALLAKHGIRAAETNDAAAEANIRGIQRLLDVRIRRLRPFGQPIPEGHQGECEVHQQPRTLI